MPHGNTQNVGTQAVFRTTSYQQNGKSSACDVLQRRRGRERVKVSSWILTSRQPNRVPSGRLDASYKAQQPVTWKHTDSV